MESVAKRSRKIPEAGFVQKYRFEQKDKLATSVTKIDKAYRRENRWQPMYSLWPVLAKGSLTWSVTINQRRTFAQLHPRNFCRIPSHREHDYPIVEPTVLFHCV